MVEGFTGLGGESKRWFESSSRQTSFLFFWSHASMSFLWFWTIVKSPVLSFVTRLL
jgi:hypothetical protein